MCVVPFNVLESLPFLADWVAHYASRSLCTGGQGTSAYEQNTQQFPFRGFISKPHFLQV